MKNAQFQITTQLIWTVIILLVIIGLIIFWQSNIFNLLE